MDIILWRHADAVDSYPDMDRVLTEKGLKQAARMAEFLRPRLPQPTRILVSPARRAQQTAQALNLEYETETAIAPNCTVESVLETVNWPHGTGCYLLVGHQPVWGEVASRLLCGGDQGFSFKKGAVWWLTGAGDAAQAHASLRLVVAPDIL